MPRTGAGPVAGWGGGGGGALDGWEAFDATTLTPKAPYQDVRVRNLTVTGTAVITSTTTSTGQFLSANGTAGAPGYSSTNDPNSGIFWNADDTMRFSLGGTERFRGTTTGIDFGAQAAWFGTAIGTIGSGLAQSAAGVIGFYGATTSVGSSAAFASTSNIRFSSTTDPDGTADLYLVRNAANELLISVDGTVNPGTGAIGNIRVGQVKWGTPAQGFTNTLRVNGSSSDIAEIVSHSGVVLFSWNQSTTGVPLVLGSVGGLASPVARFIVGEGSRSGTDSNVGGGNLTIQSGPGTGTGTVSSLIFQTPTVAGAGSGAQAQATRLTLSSTQTLATGPIATTGTGDSPTANAAFLTVDTSFAAIGWNTTSYMFIDGTQVKIRSTRYYAWSSTNGNGTSDLFLSRRGAANLQLGAADAASPVAQILSAQGSRSGTDSNVAGANLTIEAGRGTGNAATSTISFKVPGAVASGTGAQTMTEIAKITADAVDFVLATDGAAAQVGTLTNAPTAGNPAIWLKVRIAGNVRYIPAWS